MGLSVLTDYTGGQENNTAVTYKCNNFCSINASVHCFRSPDTCLIKLITSESWSKWYAKVQIWRSITYNHISIIRNLWPRVAGKNKVFKRFSEICVKYGNYTLHTLHEATEWQIQKQAHSLNNFKRCVSSQS
jgi:hypothetical protein